MKMHFTYLLVTVGLCFANLVKPDNSTFDVDAVSRQHWVQELGVHGCHYVNEVRRQYGRSQLYYSASLTNIGARHSEWMAYNNLFQHQNLDGIGAWVARQWLPVTAENIAMSSPKTHDVAWDAHEQWYYSSGHFRNMIDTHHTHCGVGIAYDRLGRWWGTQLFGQNYYLGHEYDTESALPAPSRPASDPASVRVPIPALAQEPAPTVASNSFGTVTFE